MNIWNTICKEILDKKTKQATEKEYQKLVFAHFYYMLGWHSERVEQQYQQRVGSNVQYVYPDIVFFANNEKLFVIEMKQPNHIQTKEDIEQLSSYMKLLPVQFGIYIGEHIELYYKPFDCESPTSVLKIELNIDSDKGKTFVELFKRDNCNSEKLTNFCNAQIAKQVKQKEINEFINKLTTEKGKQLFIELLNQKLLNEGYSTEDIEKITNEIVINIHHKNRTDTTHIKQYTPTQTPVINKNKQKDYTHYRLNGNGNYGKGHLALAIVQLFVRNNPQLTYNEIVNAIPLRIEKYSEIQKWKETTPDKSKDKRWREEKENLMVSADGITFAFTREIGIGNIGEIIKFGEEQGYTIEPII